jgi:HD superfamily phosphodiesterase
MALMAITDDQRQKIANYVRSYLIRTAQSMGHQNALYRATARWTHTLNVCQNLERILDGENASPDARDICMVAALFHDIDHYTVQLEYHAARGAETAKNFLAKYGFDPEFTHRVIEVIREHHRDLDDDVSIAEQVQHIVDTLSIEARMVFDADTLDKIGASNIMQAVLLMGTTKRQLAEAGKELTSGWPLQRARLWKESLTTATGKKLGEERLDFYERFLAQVEQEIVMDDPYPQLNQTQEMARVP